MPRGHVIDDSFSTAYLDWLKSIMRKNNWSASKLAAECGISPSTLSRYFATASIKTMPSTATIRKIEKATGLRMPAVLASGAQANREHSSERISFTVTTPEGRISFSCPSALSDTSRELVKGIILSAIAQTVMAENSN